MFLFNTYRLHSNLNGSIVGPELTPRHSLRRYTDEGSAAPEPGAG